MKNIFFNWRRFISESLQDVEGGPAINPAIIDVKTINTRSADDVEDFWMKVEKGLIIPCTQSAHPDYTKDPGSCQYKKEQQAIKNMNLETEILKIPKFPGGKKWMFKHIDDLNAILGDLMFHDYENPGVADDVKRTFISYFELIGKSNTKEEADDTFHEINTDWEQFLTDEKKRLKLKQLIRGRPP